MYNHTRQLHRATYQITLGYAAKPVTSKNMKNSPFAAGEGSPPFLKKIVNLPPVRQKYAFKHNFAVPSPCQLAFQTTC